MIAWYWSWILMSVNLTAMVLAGRRLWWAWLVAVVAECLWLVYGYATQQWGFSVFALVFGAVYLRNAYTWRDAPRLTEQSHRDISSDDINPDHASNEAALDARGLRCSGYGDRGSVLERRRPACIRHRGYCPRSRTESRGDRCV